MWTGIITNSNHEAKGLPYLAEHINKWHECVALEAPHSPRSLLCTRHHVHLLTTGITGRDPCHEQVTMLIEQP